MSRDTNFYYSFLVLPAEKRRAIVAVWDFCRAVDDAVDVVPVGASATDALAEWRRELDRCFGDEPPRSGQGRRLQPWVRRFTLPRQPFDDLLDGVAMDLGDRRYETFEDLYEYCIRVASAVGLICLEIFGYRDLKARDYAVSLGVALQLTNIVRERRRGPRSRSRVPTAGGPSPVWVHRSRPPGGPDHSRDSDATRIPVRSGTDVLPASEHGAAAR